MNTEEITFKEKFCLIETGSQADQRIRIAKTKGDKWLVLGKWKIYNKEEYERFIVENSCQRVQLIPVMYRISYKGIYIRKNNHYKEWVTDEERKEMLHFVENLDEEMAKRGLKFYNSKAVQEGEERNAH